MHPMRHLAVTLVIIFLLSAGCSMPTTRAPSTPEPTAVVPTETPAPAPTAIEQEVGAVTGLQDVKKATIQIEAQGSFMDPEVGLQLNAAGRGSGFIIDPSGLAITNNHVVTGAALLRVWVGGETESVHAKVVAVSECSDLAVIDLEGDGYDYLKWHEGPVTPGLDVYAAGYPLGDPEFTLTRGIVSKQRTSGQTSWASVESVIEHDATVNPGNSGGPLVTKAGEVVAINYAGDSNTNRYFAIARGEALRIIEQLRAGEDVDSIGLNGSAVSDGEDLTGIWVASVKSGSPADRAGVKAGDIVTKLEGLVLAQDGTMTDYCDILRSHSADDTMNLEVIRFATQEVLEGQLNGRELEQTFSFARELEDEVPQAATTTGTEVTYTDYVTVTDDSKAISMQIPAAWTEVSGTPWTMDEQDVGVAIAAADDLKSFYDTYDTAGVFFGASQSLKAKYSPESLLDENSFSNDCTFESRNEYQDPLYVGSYDVYSNCDERGTSLIQVAAEPEDKSFIVLVQIVAASEKDLEAMDRIIQTFQVVGQLP